MLQKRQRLRRPGMVLIDLDGTLVDTAPDLAHCVDLTMTELGLPERGEEAVRGWIGNGVPVLVHRALTGTQDEKAEPQQHQQALAIFMKHYEHNVCVHSRPYPGVLEGLEGLSDAGVRLGCVTNKPARFTGPLLEALSLSRFFGVVVSGDTLEKKKPDPAPLLYAARILESRPEDSLMVGDSMHDVQAARAAGFQVACVSYGYNHGHDIRDAGPDAVIGSLAELPSLLAID